MGRCPCEEGALPLRPLGGLCLLLVLLVAAAGAGPEGRAGIPRLYTFTSRHYTIKTNLPRTEAAVFGRHMDIVFQEYTKRFRFLGAVSEDKMPLYLFQTKDQYQTFLGQHGINASHSGGMFFMRPQIRGLATWIQDRPRSQIFAVLQHEGFHQFAQRFFGTSLPVWANEGLAQYFEDGIFVQQRMILGQRHERRVKAVRQALHAGTAIDFDQMIEMTSEQWHQRVTSGNTQVALMYDQAWSMAYYMVRTRKRRAEAFVRYIEMLSDGIAPDTAFHKVFGKTTADFRRGWEKFALSLEPDMLNTAVRRLEFLGQGMILLEKRGERIPSHIDGLRKRLRRIQFRMTVKSHGVVTKYRAMDKANYGYTHPNGRFIEFVMTRSNKPGLPPRISAQGLNPLATLVWSRDGNSTLVQEIKYR